MQKTTKALELLIECIDNHKKYDEVYNYEDFVKEQFKKKGNGFVMIEASDFVKVFIEGSSRAFSLDHRYITLGVQKVTNDSAFEESLRVVNQYDPSSEYAVLIAVDRDKLPLAEALEIPNQMLYCTGRFKLTQLKKPSKLVPLQIRKRLNRMIDEGIRFLVLDTSEPDYMGENLGKWLREIKRLQSQGKHISTVIDSEKESDAIIPDDLRDDVRQLVFKNPQQ